MIACGFNQLNVALEFITLDSASARRRFVNYVEARPAVAMPANIGHSASRSPKTSDDQFMA
jgi:hypothetical protein